MIVSYCKQPGEISGIWLLKIHVCVNKLLSDSFDFDRQVGLTL